MYAALANVRSDAPVEIGSAGDTGASSLGAGSHRNTRSPPQASRSRGRTKLPTPAGTRPGSARGLCVRRHAVTGDDAVVVEAHQRDHVTDVGFALDPARGRPLPVGEYGMVHQAPLVEQLRPELLREEEMRGVVAVQVADLAAADLEGELAA